MKRTCYCGKPIKVANRIVLSTTLSCGEARVHTFYFCSYECGSAADGRMWSAFTNDDEMRRGDGNGL